MILSQQLYRQIETQTHIWSRLETGHTPGGVLSPTHMMEVVSQRAVRTSPIHDWEVEPDSFGQERQKMPHLVSKPLKGEEVSNTQL